MDSVLKAQTRDGRGKGAARKLRAQGLVPGVLYGHGVEPVAISLSSQDLLHFFHSTHGATTVFDLEVDGTKHMAIAREIQRDHLHGRYVHIDFLAVRRDEKVKMSVEIHEIGEAPGVKTGGVIEHHLRDVEIECLPGNVPEQITADISSLELGDMLRLSDIPAPTGVTYLTDPETPVATPGPSGLDYTAGERYLQDGIRRGAIDCAPAAGSDEMPGAAVAGIECYSDDPSLARLGFYLFASDADMLDAYRFEMSAQGVAFDSGTCHDGEHEGAYTPGDGFVSARHGCFMDGEGRASYRATLPGDHVYISVLSGRDNMSYVEDFAWLGNQDAPGRPTLWAAPR